MLAFRLFAVEHAWGRSTSAAGNLGRALAVLDALIGQIYLVEVVALLVSHLGRSRT